VVAEASNATCSGVEPHGGVAVNDATGGMLPEIGRNRLSELVAMSSQ
jgi:hypothetical protein